MLCHLQNNEGTSCFPITEEGHACQRSCREGGPKGLAGGCMPDLNLGADQDKDLHWCVIFGFIFLNLSFPPHRSSVLIQIQGWPYHSCWSTWSQNSGHGQWAGNTYQITSCRQFWHPAQSPLCWAVFFKASSIAWTIAIVLQEIWVFKHNFFWIISFFFPSPPQKIHCCRLLKNKVVGALKHVKLYCDHPWLPTSRPLRLAVWYLGVQQ